MLTVRSTINVSSQTVPQIIPVVQGDTGRAILFTLADFTIPAGAVATYYVQKPSGEAVYNNATIDGNTVLVELTAQSIIEKGDNYGQVRIAVGEDVVTSFDFILLVKEFRGIDATQSLTEMNIFDKAVEQAADAIDEVKTDALDDIGDAKDAALQEIEQSTGNFADDFSASATYAAGDYVMHSGQLYRFTANHAAGAWTGSDAEAVTVGEELTDLKAESTSLKEDMQQLYDPTTLDDMYGENTSVVKTDNVLTSATWDGDTKTVTVTMSGSASSADSYYVILSPKFIANHTYKIAIKYLYPTEFAYTYIRNVFSTSNFNSRDDIVNGAAKYNNVEEVLTFSATSDGWLALATMVPANTQRNWSWKLAVYDVTNIDISGVSDSDFLSFEDVTIGADGIVPQIQAKAEYIYPLVSNVQGETWTALGDSLTAQGSGSQYLGYVKSRLGLANYYNCGIGGTTISGATNVNAMYQDVRINALNLGSNAVTILGGTNDAWQEYYKNHPSANLTGWGDCVRTNHDVSTFCGAYNVMLSKIFYKFCKVNGYYEDVDYSGITQVTTAIDNFRVILMTPSQAFHVEGDSMSANLQLNGLTAAHSYVKQIAELWSLPCVDTWEMGMNDMNRSLFFANYLTDATHFNAFGHERLASLIIDKALQVSRYK